MIRWEPPLRDCSRRREVITYLYVSCGENRDCPQLLYPKYEDESPDRMEIEISTEGDGKEDEKEEGNFLGVYIKNVEKRGFLFFFLIIISRH